jgi:PTS system cellobiose-specific IIB component
MRNIVLFCSVGMSTSLLVNKMKEAAKEMHYECSIVSSALSNVPVYGPKADIILLGPQIRFSLEDVKKQCPGVTVESINMTDYGTMNGAKVLAQVKQALGDL